jgi:hypothetical protein
MAKLASRLRGQAGDVSVMLPFEEVAAALGRTGERRLGLQTIRLDSIVGSVDRSREFDREFRPRSKRVRQRWQRINEAQRRGQGMPPISVYRIGEMHFVEDGHHRVSVACYRRFDVIEAYVTEIITRVRPGERLSIADLPAKSHERLFLERVPLSPRQVERISFAHPDEGYARLAEGIEAWGFRLMQALEEPLDRAEVAAAWFRDEYEPVVATLREADLVGSDTETDAYMRVATQRYMLLRTHEWGEEVMTHLREQLD